MDDRLKPLMQQLGDAINEALSESEDIIKVIEEIKGAGYDVFLILEVTIGFNKREGEKKPRDASTPNKVTVDFRFTPQDKKLLGEMHILADDDDKGLPKKLPKLLSPPKNPKKPPKDSPDR